MKRSVTCLGMTLGSAALIALGVGCSRASRPAQAPPAGTTSPTFESNVPPTPAPPPPPGPEMAAPAPPPPAAAPPPPPEMGAPTQPSTPPEPPMGATGAAGGGENERQMCDALAGAAVLHVEDVQNGAAIVMAPKTGHDLASVRDEARRIETTMRQRGTVETAPAPGTSCGLFSVAQLPGVSAQLIEGAKRVRIVLTTPNPAEVKDVRRLTRDQVMSLGKAHPR
jgi:hypothetical protein